MIGLIAQLRANGQVGDMIVYSNAGQRVVEGVIDAVKKTKFIPALKDGKAVDSEEYFVFTFYSLGTVQPYFPYQANFRRRIYFRSGGGKDFM